MWAARDGSHPNGDNKNTMPTPRLFTAFLLLLAALAAGCSPYKMLGDEIYLFTEHRIIPYELADNDFGMACHAATAMAAPALTFERVGTHVGRMAVLLSTANGMCAEGDAFEQELIVLRGLYRADPFEAQDARIRQKRLLELAARRQLVAWNRFVQVYGDLPEGKCPKFRSDFDEMVFMVGIIGGVQGVLNDAQAGQVVGISREIAPKAAHLSECLDSAKWWGVPESIRVALWNILPSNAPEGVEPMKMLHEIATRGGLQGVRLGYLTWTMAAWGSGDRATTRQALQEFAQAGQSGRIDPQYRMLDAIAEGVMRGMSDRLWTEAVGYRTPQGALGTFPGDKPAGSTDISDLLE